MGNPEAFERMLRDTYNMTLEEFGAHVSTSRSMPVQLWGNTPQTQKLVAITTASTYRDQPDVVCVLSLQTDRFRQMLSAHAETNGYSLLWMVSPDGTVFSTQAQMELSQGEELDAASLYAAYLEGGVPKDAILTDITETQSGWSLFSAVSAEQYQRPLRSIQVSYVVYLAICLALGLTFSVIFSHRHYSPLRRFAQKLRLPTDSAAMGYDALQTALDSLIEREAESSSKVRQHQYQLRQAALVRILRGQVVSPALFESLCAENGLLFSTRRFLCIGISIRDVGDFLQSASGKPQGEDDEELLRYLIVSIMEELLQMQADGYAFSMDDQAFCMVSPRDDAQSAEGFCAAIAKVCGDAGAFIAEHTGIRMTFYLSDLCQDDEDYILALKTATHDVFWGLEQIESFQLEDGVLNREALKHTHSALMEASGEYQNQQQRNRFILAAMSGNLDEAFALYKGLRYSGPFPSGQSFANIQLNSALLISQLAEEALTPAQFAAHRDMVNGWFSGLHDTRTNQELEQRIKQILRQMQVLSNSRQGSEDQRASYAQVMEYIGENYTDPMLSVSSICDHFQVSSSYLLKLFKRHRQSGVFDGIQQRRVETAKLLLRTTQQTVAQVAQEVGYTNTLALNRAFKRTEGITPTDYRNLTNP